MERRALRGTAALVVNLDKATIRAIIELIDKSPAVLWAGKGGVKERLESLIEEGEG